jgi:hypothetical protein
MTQADASAQAQSYDDLQNRLAAEAANYSAQQAALPSSPQNFSSSFQPQVNTNVAALNPFASNSSAISLASPYSTQYQPY